MTFSNHGTTARFGGGGGLSGFGGDPGGGRRDDPPPDFREILQRYRLGLAVGVVAIFMLFFSFSVAYLVRLLTGVWDIHTQRYIHTANRLNLPLGLLMFNTAVLLAASLSLEFARRTSFREAALTPITTLPGIAKEKSHTKIWTLLSLMLGITFLCGQGLVWKELVARGYYLSGNPSASFFYLLTSLHAIHLFGGVLALLWALIGIPHRPRSLERRRIILDISAWYWHFMGALWLFILLLLVLAH